MDGVAEWCPEGATTSSAGEWGKGIFAGAGLTARFYSREPCTRAPSKDIQAVPCLHGRFLVRYTHFARLGRALRTHWGLSGRKTTPYALHIPEGCTVFSDLNTSYMKIKAESSEPQRCGHRRWGLRRTSEYPVAHWYEWPAEPGQRIALSQSAASLMHHWPTGSSHAVPVSRPAWRQGRL